MTRSREEDSVVFGPLPHGLDDVFHLRVSGIAQQEHHLLKRLPGTATTRKEAFHHSFLFTSFLLNDDWAGEGIY